MGLGGRGGGRSLSEACSVSPANENLGQELDEKPLVIFHMPRNLHSTSQRGREAEISLEPVGKRRGGWQDLLGSETDLCGHLQPPLISVYFGFQQLYAQE